MISKHSDLAPLAANTRCRAKCPFQGESVDDLSFETGEVLTILRPDKAMFWYIARNNRGQEGTIPITMMEIISEGESFTNPPPLPPRPSRRPSEESTVFHNNNTHHSNSYITDGLSNSSPLSPPHHHPSGRFNSPPPPLPPPNTPPVAGQPKPFHSIDTRPPMPLPVNTQKPSSPTSPSAGIKTGKYSTIQKFHSESGWFSPTVDMVLSSKINMSLHVFRRVTSAVYYFQHKYDRSKHYVGKSLRLYNDLTQLFSRLYERPVEHLNPLEMELRFQSPEANLWNFRAWQYSPTEIDLECAKLIIKQKSLKPSGLNEELKFESKEQFNKFCMWYTEERQKLKASSS